MTSSGPRSADTRRLATAGGGAETSTAPLGRFLSRGVWRRVGVLVLLGAATGCLLLELNLQFANKKNTLDFLAFYTAGTMLRHGEARRLYDLGLQAQLERQLLSESTPLSFYHPAYEAWVFEPLAHLSLSRAFLSWTVVNLVVLGLVFWLFRSIGYPLDQDRRLVWLIASLPAVAGTLVKGQDTMPLALVFLLAFLALKKRREVLAGLVLGMGLFRFEVLLPFLFIFFLRRRWKVLAGSAVMAAAGVAGSVAIVGWKGLVQYFEILVQAGRARGSLMSGNVAQMPSLRGALAALFGPFIPTGFFFPLALVGTLLLLGWAAWEFRDVGRAEKRAFDLQFSLALIAALIASYHLFVYVLTPLLVAAFLILGWERAAQQSGRPIDRAGTILLLLVGLVPICGSLAHFYDFSVLVIVLFGLAAWCAQEDSGERERA